MENVQKEVVSQTSQLISVDIGKSDVKVMYEEKMFKFSTALTKVRVGGAEYSEVESQDTYEYKGKMYMVGERANFHSVSTRGINFLANNAALFVFHAMKISGVVLEKEIKLVTTLSIEDWKIKDEFLQSLETIKVDDYVISPDVVLYAQGQGAYEEYNGAKNGIICVFDGGYNTNDFLVFENGKPRHDLSMSTRKGTNEMITQLQSKIKKELHFDCTEQIAKKAFLEKSISNFNQDIDLVEYVEDLTEEYIEYTFEELITYRGDTLRQADAVIVCGGIANYINLDDLPSNVHRSNVPEYANVRGCYNAEREN